MDMKELSDQVASLCKDVHTLADRFSVFDKRTTEQQGKIDYLINRVDDLASHMLVLRNRVDAIEEDEDIEDDADYK